MISTNDRTKDVEDFAVLNHALIRYVEANEERTDESLVCVGYVRILTLADQAATEIALQSSDQGDDWDGTLWFERIEAIDEDSLAAALLAPGADVANVVHDWLQSFN
jgi:mRNA-degrading endonuclease toxin of MazEF toxin-antitoxin module